MKKKIILLAAALMMFMGVVSASSINGDYKGNPIVKVMSNGKQLQSDEVPAMIYDGHTVVPISLLRQIGASVEWNADTYSVNVSLPTQAISTKNTDKTRETFDSILPTVKTLGGKELKIIYDEYGSYASVRFDGSNNTQVDYDSIAKLSTIAAAFNFQETRVIYYINNVYMNEFVANKDDAQLWLDKKITDTEFTNRIKIINVSNTNSSPKSSTPQISQETINQVNQAKCSLINRDYDTAIANVRVDMGARGLSKGSMEINSIKKLNDERNDKLTILGCPIK